MTDYLTPHSKEWFEALEKFNAQQAAHTRQVINLAKSDEVCSVCGDDPASDYRLIHPVPSQGAPDTIRLCDDCRMIRERSGESFVSLAE